MVSSCTLQARLYVAVFSYLVARYLVRPHNLPPLYTITSSLAPTPERPETRCGRPSCDIFFECQDRFGLAR